jgi:hypothetical protein
MGLTIPIPREEKGVDTRSYGNGWSYSTSNSGDKNDIGLNSVIITIFIINILSHKHSQAFSLVLSSSLYCPAPACYSSLPGGEPQILSRVSPAISLAASLKLFSRQNQHNQTHNDDHNDDNVSSSEGSRIISTKSFQVLLTTSTSDTSHPLPNLSVKHFSSCQQPSTLRLSWTRLRVPPPSTRMDLLSQEM